MNIFVVKISNGGKTVQNKKMFTYDILGISSAVLCLLHCLVFPLFILIPFRLADNYIIDAFFAFIGVFVVIKILRSNTRKIVKIILGVSILLVIMSIVLEIIFKKHFHLIFVGGVGMIIGHLLNYVLHEGN